MQLIMHHEGTFKGQSDARVLTEVPKIHDDAANVNFIPVSQRLSRGRHRRGWMHQLLPAPDYTADTPLETASQTFKKTKQMLRQ